MSPSDLYAYDFTKCRSLWEKFVEDYTKELEVEREFQLNIAKYIVKSLAITK